VIGRFTIDFIFRIKTMIHVIATLHAAPGRGGDLLREFKRIVPTVRAEAGCIEYGPTVDIDSGIEGLPPARADVLTVVEKWESVSALKAHLSAAHMHAYRVAVKDVLAGAEIRVLEPV
jgi:quinol monooxygenase YgiN